MKQRKTAPPPPANEALGNPADLKENLVVRSKAEIKNFALKMRKIDMGWNTVYITGRADFREEVLKRLEGSDVNFMPGNTGASSDLDTHDLYWLDDKVDIRKFKQAIGSKLVWKFRLNFYTSLEAFIESQKNNRRAEEEKAEAAAFSVNELLQSAAHQGLWER